MEEGMCVYKSRKGGNSKKGKVEIRTRPMKESEVGLNKGAWNKAAEARERSRASSGCSRRKSSRQPCGVNGGGRVLKGPHHDSLDSLEADPSLLTCPH